MKESMTKQLLGDGTSAGFTEHMPDQEIDYEGEVYETTPERTRRATEAIINW